MERLFRESLRDLERNQQHLTRAAFPLDLCSLLSARVFATLRDMASPVARSRRIQRPATIERASTLRPRALSLAETSPYRRASASSIDDIATPTPFGPYLVYEQLGEGGMAHVHRAELVTPSGLRKQVALKRLNTDACEDPALVASFVHEAQLAARLHHPNIVQAYDLGKIDDTYYMAMELVPGPTLWQVMTLVQNGGAGAVPLPIALEILIEICDALDHVHGLCDEGGKPLELIHRDVSPANIIISRTGAAKLIDFGIAKVRSSRHATEAGIIKGKHGYVAPEYTYGHLDQRADLFALGVVAHELISGRRLFLADTAYATIANVRHLPVPPPSRFAPGVSSALDAIVLTALEREPGMRWQSAGALRAALVEEARKQPVAISGPQIRDWVEWAFNQTPRRDSSVDRCLDGLDPSVSIVIEIEEPELRVPEVVEPPPPAVESKKPAQRRKPRNGLPARAPRWRAPTRWTSPPHRRSAAPALILLALFAFGMLAADQGWIDLERLRTLLSL